MHDRLLRLTVRLWGLIADERGQDLVEYALLVSMIALVCVSGVKPIASSLNSWFNNISTTLA